MLEWCKSGPGTEQFESEHAPSVSVVCYLCSMLTRALPFLWVFDSVLTQKLRRTVWGCQVVEVNRLQWCSPDTWTVMGWDVHRKRGKPNILSWWPSAVVAVSVDMKGKGSIKTLQVKQQAFNFLTVWKFSTNLIYLLFLPLTASLRMPHL